MVLKIPQLYYDVAEKFYTRKLHCESDCEVEMERLYEGIEKWLVKDLDWSHELAEEAVGKIIVGLKNMGYISRKEEEESEEVVYEVW
jgi:hypothetical protein